MSSNSSRPAVEGRGVSRRTLVKGAAHAAWVVPAVQVVSVVPAFAASGPCAIAVIGTPTGTFNASTERLATTFTLKNTGVGDAKLVTVIFTFSPYYQMTGSVATASVAAWTATRDNSSSTVTFRRSLDLAAGASETVTFTMSGKLRNNPPAGSTPTATYVVSGSRTGTSGGACDGTSGSVSFA